MNGVLLDILESALRGLERLGALTRFSLRLLAMSPATMDRLPHVGRIGRSWYATGCNGSGVATNTWLGHRLAGTVAGTAPPPAFAHLKHRAIPAKGWSPAYLPLVSRVFAWQDRR